MTYHESHIKAQLFKMIKPSTPLSCQYTKGVILALKWLGLFYFQIRMVSRGSCLSWFSDQSPFGRDSAGRSELPRLNWIREEGL